MDENKGILIYLDNRTAANKNTFYGGITDTSIYNCGWYWPCNTLDDLRKQKDNLLQVFDHFVIHFDDFYPDFLNEMVANKHNTKDFQVRIHGVPKETFFAFKKFVDENWESQEGWRPWGFPKEWLEEE